MKKLLKYFKGYEKQCVFGPLFKLLEAGFELFVPLVIADIIDKGISNNDRGYIVSRVGILFALAFIGLICSVFAQYFSAYAAVGFATVVRSSLFSHIQKLSYKEIDRSGTARLITRLTSDVNQLQSAVNMTLRLFLRSPFIVFGAMIMAFTIDTKCAMIFVVTILLLCVVVYGVMIITIPLQKRVGKDEESVLRKTRDNLLGNRVIRAFNMQRNEIDDFKECNEKLKKDSLVVGRISGLTEPLTFLIINLATIYLIYKGAICLDLFLAGSGTDAVKGSISTPGQIVALLNYMSQILVELIKLAGFIVLDIKGLACAQRIAEVLDTEVSQQYGEKERSDNYTVEFDGVSFTYDKSQEAALDDISFKAEKGEFIGIVGGTGSGKSTLVNLLNRSYDCSHGVITIGKENIADYTKSFLADTFAVVPQKAVLFAGTIRENLRMANENASENDMKEALENACALEFVMEKEGGLDYPISAKGKNLSGGQKQRITIARALIKKPQVLILDDSLSALDAITAKKVLSNVKNLDYKPTVFLISQRSTRLEQADKIIVLDDGHVVGYGKHDELLKDCEVYREIHESGYITKVGKRGEENG